MSTQPPIEDINAIVGRFQAWSGAQTPSRTKDGVRELTYDEAIRSRQHRSRVEGSLPEAEKPEPVQVESAKPLKMEKSAKPKKRIAPSRHIKHEPPKNAPRPRAAHPVAAPEPPAFRQVLAEKVSILPASSSQELALADRRTTALSLRISFTEHALLKRRAAEENLSVSCYLRNCVFEVEELRAQVNDLRAAKEAPQSLRHQGGILEGIGRFFSGIFGGNKHALSLRA
ncbi:MAG TPA: hypothetical protein VKH40_12570 [Alloacidobacterium sp.]|nr:hypothetical protein [Alloacidobacterium sp.]